MSPRIVPVPPAPSRRRLVAALAVPLTLILAVAGCDEIKIEKRDARPGAEAGSGGASGEVHLQGIHRLTEGGRNRQPALSPDGRQLAWLQRPTDTDHDRIMVMDLTGCAPQPVGDPEWRYRGVSFTPDGRGLLYARAPWRPAPSAGTVGPEPYVGGLFPADMDLVRHPLDGGRPVPLTGRAGYDAEAACSRDGRRIVYTALEDGRAALRLLDVESGESRELLSWPGYAGEARFSPLGDAIVFQAARREGRGGVAIYICRADGSDVRLLDGAGSTCFSPEWHPSGQFVIYAGDIEDGDHELFRIAPEGGERERLTFHRGLDAYPVFSRDGRTLIWVSQREGTRQGATDIVRATWIP